MSFTILITESVTKETLTDKQWAIIRKTAVRRLCKYLPKSQALAAALEVQAKTEAGEHFDNAEVLRPGDCNIPEEPEKNEEGFWVWSEEDTAAFHTARDVLFAACDEAGLPESERDEKIEHYKAQKASGEDSPGRVLARMGHTTERIGRKK